MADAARQPAGEDAADRPAVMLRRVLVVDDSEANRYVVTRWLREAGFDVTEAASGEEALRAARDADARPDLILLDIRLPDTSGFDVLRQLRDDERTTEIPVVHLSASFTTGEWRAHGLEAGAEAYLTHPVEPRELVATVRSLLRVRQAGARREQLLQHERTARREADIARAAAERVAGVKADFLATMSHEFRTPLNAFTGYLQLLEMELVGPLTTQQRDYVQRLKASSEHLSALVNDVLDLAKLEANRMTVAREAAWTTSVVDAAISLAKPQAHARGVRLEDHSTGEGEGYLGDEYRVRQILLNLLSNAVKFTDPGGTVAVSSRRVPGPDAGWTELRVSDTGIGIPRERQEAIFEPFVQVEGGDPGPYRRTRGGTGLGLTISRRFARLMGGDLAVESTLGRGSVFTLRLPALDGTARPTPTSIAVVRASDAPGTASVDEPLLRMPALSVMGDALRSGMNDLLARFATRLREDASLPGGTRTLDRRRLTGHAPTLLAAIAQTLHTLDDPTGIPSATALRDHDQLQRTVAELHGRQRARIGWSPADLAREFEHLEALLLEFVHAHLGASDEARASVTALLHQSLDSTGRVAEQALRRAHDVDEATTT